MMTGTGCVIVHWLDNPVAPLVTTGVQLLAHVGIDG